MRNQILNINDLDVARDATVYTCYGLGSCVGLFLVDRMKGLSGGAHIALPDSFAASDFPGALMLIDELLSILKAEGSDLNSLRAKVTGGAHVVEGSWNIGEQNSKVILRRLIDKKIFIAATDLGGQVSRTARFNTVTGLLQISTSELKTYCI